MPFSRSKPVNGAADPKRDNGDEAGALAGMFDSAEAVA
jgi:hypothetical protein